MSAFTGFAPTLAFLKDVTANNNRDWFQAHKERYHNEYLPPIQAFIETVGPHLREISPGLQADPRPNGGSMMRIYRDTRFSKDKTPYKTWLGVTFWEGTGKKTEMPGFHFYMDNTGAHIYGHQHSFPRDVLPKFRRSIDNAGFGPQFQAALDTVAACGDYEIGGEQYKRVPNDYDPEHPRGDQLRYKGIYAKSPVIPVEKLTSPALIDLCRGHFQDMAPLHHWLVEMNSQA